MRVGSLRFGHALVVAGLVVALAACSPTTPTPTPTPSAETEGPSPQPTEAPEIDLDGDAAANKPFFDQVNRQLIDSGTTLSGRAFIENLVQAGYPREAMELTPDQTNVQAADSIQFAIRLGDSCLVGQYGNVGYASVATTLIESTGTCLIGTPRPAG